MKNTFSKHCPDWAEWEFSNGESKVPFVYKTIQQQEIDWNDKEIIYCIISQIVAEHLGFDKR